MNRSGRWTFDLLVCVLMMSAIALAAALSPMQNDTWWHLRAGADMIRTGHVLETDTYSHTALGSPWPNHEWLAQVVFYVAYALGGLPLLMLETAAVTVTAWLIVWRLCRGDVLLRAVIIGTFALPASMHWEPRPHIFSILFVPWAVQLVIADKLAWLPVLFLVWANCHGGVVLGLIVVVVAVTAAIIDRPWRWRHHVLILTLCAGAITLTPLGMSIWRDIAAALGRIQQYPIDEWRPPQLTDGRFAPFWAAAAMLIAGTAANWRKLLTADCRQTRVLCVTALSLVPAAVGAVRNVGLFLMLAAPALTALASLYPHLFRVRTRREHSRINASACMAAVIAVVIGVSGAYYLRIPRLRWTPLPPASLRALDQCPDNLYNRYDEGGYLIWFAPNHRVFLDGRQDPYPPSLVKEQLAIEQSGDFAAVFRRYRIHCAFLPAASPVAMHLSAVGWQSLYRDGSWVVLMTPFVSSIDLSARNDR